MFKHIVLWKLKDTAGGRTKAENASLIKERFEELANMLDGLHHLEVGLDLLHTDASADVALYTEFESRAAFEAYYAHPAHQALAAFIMDLRIDRRVIDYEV
jgi:hypothetical protein